MRLGKLGTVGAFAVGLPLGLLPLTRTTWSQQSTALDRLRSGDTSGKVKEIDLDRTKVTIAEPPRSGPGTERPALKTAAAVQTSNRRAETAGLRTEINQRLRGLESCRGSARGGQIQLRWTVLPDGRISNTLVLEQQPTDMDVMKCARKRMDGWRFSPSAAGPIDVESSYSFARPERSGTADVVAGDNDRTTPAEEKKSPEGKSSEAKLSEAKLSEAKLSEAKLNDAKLNDADNGEGKSSEGKGRGNDGKLNEAHQIDGK